MKLLFFLMFIASSFLFACNNGEGSGKVQKAEPVKVDTVHKAGDTITVNDSKTSVTQVYFEAK